MDKIMGSIRMITNGSILSYLLKGLAFTLVIAVFAVVFGIIIGSVLALARNYCSSPRTKIFKWLSVAYIEIFRNTPLMLWIFIGLVYFPSVDVSTDFAQLIGNSRTEVALLIKAVIALVLFTSSVIAEIIRGGLNSIPKGQFEAAYSQGFNFVQTLIYVILPQTFKNIIPTLLSQVITTIKDTSYVANIAVAELLGRTFQVIQISPRYTGFTSQNVSDVFALCGLACVFYFIVNFTLSCIVRRMQKPKVRKAAVKAAA